MNFFKKMAYTAVDFATRGRGVSRIICGENIKFPSRWSRYYESDYEPETFAFFRENVQKGDTVLDIGGHIGLFAVVIAKLVGNEGKVLTFEPTPFTRSVLQETIDLNHCSATVEVRGEAVSSKAGESVFFDTGDTVSNANSLVKTGRSKDTIPIRTISVDGIVKERSLNVSCLKIDVEGAELDVLIGARDTFLTQRPKVRLGLHPSSIAQNSQSLDEIWGLVSDYKMNVIYQGQPIGKDRFCRNKDLFDVTLEPL